MIVSVGVGYDVSQGTSYVWDHLPDGFTGPVDDAVGSAWDQTKHYALDDAKGYLDIIGIR